MSQHDLEISVPRLPITPNSPAHDVIRLQEWLVVRGFDVGANPGAPADLPAAAGVDGGFGAGTLAGCEAFARANGLSRQHVDREYWEHLTSGMRQAFSFKSTQARIGDAIVETAEAHLGHAPIEARRLANGRLVGLDNSGPWVRAYCSGLSVEWCQGAASQWVKQAFAALGASPPFSLDAPKVLPLFVPSIAAAARRAGRFVLGSDGGNVARGSFFFLRGMLHGEPSHVHVGITASTIRRNGAFDTIEANTSDDASGSGWKVCRRVRNRSTCDFGILA